NQTPGERTDVSAQGNAGEGVEGTAGPGIVIAIDGPSGSGKSSTSKGVARARGLAYLDTGAMYRAITWWMLRNGIEAEDAVAVADAASKPVITMGTDPSAPTVQVDGTDVAGEIRTQEVTSSVSAVSAVPAVRERLVAMQRDTIAQARRESGGIVVEARARRRSKQNSSDDVAGTQEALAPRDRLDSSRAVSPLTRTADAVELETTGLGLQEVVDLVLGLADEAAAAEASPAVG